MDNAQVAERLRRFGTARFGTMAGMADALGMTASALNSSYLNGRSVPGAKVLAKLFENGCSSDWLLFGAGLPPAPTPDELQLFINYLAELQKLWKQYRQALIEAERQFGASMHAAAYIGFVENQQRLLDQTWSAEK